MEIHKQITVCSHYAQRESVGTDIDGSGTAKLTTVPANAIFQLPTSSAQKCARHEAPPEAKGKAADNTVSSPSTSRKDQEPDVDDHAPPSPSEIRVSTLRMISKKHGIDAEQCAQESPSAPKVVEIMEIQDMEIQDREWPLNGIVDSKMNGNERMLLVHWSDSYFHPQYIHQRVNGCHYVLIDGVEEWDVHSFEEIGAEDDSLRLCLIKWVHTWKPEYELENAPDLVKAFDEKREREQAARRIPSFQPINRRSPNFAAAVGVQEDALEDLEQVEDDAFEVVAMRFKPEAGKSYRGGDFRNMFARMSWDTREPFNLWRPEADRRALTFRPQFVLKGREYNLQRQERRRAIYDYICGIEQEQQCENCEAGNGPFPKCVVALNSHNGACANCACGATAKICNFHPESEYKRASASAKLIHCRYKAPLGSMVRAAAHASADISFQ